MKVWQVLRIERLKLKRLSTSWLIIGAPLIVLVLQYLNFTLRADVLTDDGYYHWPFFVQQVSAFWGALFLPILTSIIAGMIGAVEHNSNAWKLILTAPFARTNWYIGKLIFTIALVSLSTVLLSLGMLLVGFILDLPEYEGLPYATQVFFYSLMGVAALLTIQVWISTYFDNLALPVGVGIVGVVISMFLIQSPLMRWFPWIYPFMTYVGSETLPIRYGIQSVIVGCAVSVVGIWEFNRRNV